MTATVARPQPQQYPSPPPLAPPPPPPRRQRLMRRWAMGDPPAVLQMWSRAAADAGLYDDAATAADAADERRPPSRWALRKAAAIAEADSLGVARGAHLDSLISSVASVASVATTDSAAAFTGSATATAAATSSPSGWIARAQAPERYGATAVESTAAAASSSSRPVTPEQQQLRQLQAQLRRIRSSRPFSPLPSRQSRVRFSIEGRLVSVGGRPTGDGDDDAGGGEGPRADAVGGGGGEGRGADGAGFPILVWRSTVAHVLNEAGVALDGGGGGGGGGGAAATTTLAAAALSSGA
ncbi:hypothetical protein PLESTF_001941500 [Pleodorina starrii]|nr:hypothetical protein PLESTF_001941500 [Pleodorina starrii]